MSDDSHRPPAPRAPAPRAMFMLRASAPRTPVALRAALGLGLPIAIGLATGHVQHGFIATLGAFTGLYGAGEPYARRAVRMAAVGAGLTTALVAGQLAAHPAWLGVLVVAVVAGAAGFCCLAVQIPPPGVVMFVLLCATGTSMPSGHVLRNAALVASAAAMCWLISMSGALIAPLGPQRAAVRGARRAVAGFLEAVGTPGEDAARHQAGLALHRAWTALADTGRTDEAATLLRARAHHTHQRFAASLRGDPVPPQEESPAPPPDARIPFGLPGTRTLLAAAASRTSQVPGDALRIAGAVLVADAVTHAIGIPQPGWGAVTAAAVLGGVAGHGTEALHRGLQRSAGTAVGVLLTAAITAARPGGVALLLILMALQYIVEVLVTRNYALASCFITPLALLVIEQTGNPLAPSKLLGARLLDTLVGSAVAITVGMFARRGGAVERLRSRLAAVLRDSAEVFGHAGRGVQWDGDTLRARRELQRGLIALRAAYDAAAGELPSARRRAEELWLAVAATQRIGYLALSSSWRSEPGAVRAAPSPAGFAAYRAALYGVADAAESGGPPAPPALPPDGPPALDRELIEVSEALGLPARTREHRAP